MLISMTRSHKVRKKGPIIYTSTSIFPDPFHYTRVLMYISETPPGRILSGFGEGKGVLFMPSPSKPGHSCLNGSKSHCSFWHQDAMHLGNNYPIPCWVYSFSSPLIASCSFYFNPKQDIMCKIKGWVVDEKKHVRYYPDWNDKEVRL